MDVSAGEVLLQKSLVGHVHVVQMANTVVEIKGGDDFAKNAERALHCGPESDAFLLRERIFINAYWCGNPRGFRRNGLRYKAGVGVFDRPTD